MHGGAFIVAWEEARAISIELELMHTCEAICIQPELACRERERLASLERTHGALTADGPVEGLKAEAHAAASAALYCDGVCGALLWLLLQRAAKQNVKG